MSTKTSSVGIKGGCRQQVVDFDEMELSLGLPGESRKRRRRFSEMLLQQVDLKLAAGRSLEKPQPIINESAEGECSDNFDPSSRPPSKERVIGWPPVRSYSSRKKSSSSNSSNGNRSKYIKVAVDGAPYLRKLDLQSYTCYHRLLRAIQDMFPALITIQYKHDDDHSVLNIEGRNIIMDDDDDDVNISPSAPEDHVPTYEDKDGDWMLLGDVPWKMFVETCNRIRLMKSSDR